MDLNEMRARYEREEGYSHLNATARVCQDVILSKLAVSSMHDRVTSKGRGTLLFSFMHSTSLRAFSRCRRHLRGFAEAVGAMGIIRDRGCTDVRGEVVRRASAVPPAAEN